MKKRVLIILLCIMIVIPLNSCGIDPQEQEYQQALQDLSGKNYEAAIEHFANLQDYKDSEYYYNNFVFLPKSVNSSIGKHDYIVDYDNMTIQKFNYSDNESSSEKYIYNTKNLVQEIIFINSDGEEESSIIYTYDNSDKLVRLDYTTGSSIVLDYDIYGNVEKCSFYYTDDVLGDRVHEYIYTYDNRNNLTSYTLFSGNVGEQLVEDKLFDYTYEYDSNNNCIAKQTITGEPDVEYYSKRGNEYSYDFNNKLVVSTEYEYNNYKLFGNSTTKTIYTYSGDNCIQVDYTYEHETDEEIRTETVTYYYEYDRYGNLIHGHYVTDDGVNRSYDNEYELIYWEGGLPKVFGLPHTNLDNQLGIMEHQWNSILLNNFYRNGDML